MDDSNEFLPGFIIGAIIAAYIAGCFWGDEITPQEYSVAEKVCVDNLGLKKIKGYFYSQTVICENGAEFYQSYDLIKLGKY